jgi:hypothetical protein
MTSRTCATPLQHQQTDLAQWAQDPSAYWIWRNEVFLSGINPRRRFLSSTPLEKHGRDSTPELHNGQGGEDLDYLGTKTDANKLRLPRYYEGTCNWTPSGVRCEPTGGAQA